MMSFALKKQLFYKLALFKSMKIVNFVMGKFQDIAVILPLMRIGRV